MKKLQGFRVGDEEVEYRGRGGCARANWVVSTREEEVGDGMCRPRAQRAGVAWVRASSAGLLAPRGRGALLLRGAKAGAARGLRRPVILHAIVAASGGRAPGMTMHKAS
jgi:hypothetical protein